MQIRVDGVDDKSEKQGLEKEDLEKTWTKVSERVYKNLAQAGGDNAKVSERVCENLVQVGGDEGAFGRGGARHWSRRWRQAEADCQKRRRWQRRRQ